MSGDRASCPDIVVIDRYGSDRYPRVYCGRLGTIFPSLIIDLVPGLLLPYKIGGSAFIILAAVSSCLTKTFIQDIISPAFFHYAPQSILTL